MEDDKTVTVPEDDVQPTRRRQGAPRRHDKTQLRASKHGRYVHRDYAAHFFRWGFAGRFIKRGDRVLDAGCGQDLPLFYLLTGKMSCIPSELVAVDLNRLDPPTCSWLRALGQFDFVARHEELGLFDVVVSYEVLEHMTEQDGYAYLAALRSRLRPTGVCLLSTPCFDGKAAANHVHEWPPEALRGALEGSGFKVRARHGTFASWNDVKRAAAPEHLAVAERLREFYDGDVVACFLAPLYPDASRNVCWVLDPA